MGQRWITEIVENARRLSTKYPATLPEVREITQSIVPKILQKLVSTSRPAEPVAPPV